MTRASLLLLAVAIAFTIAFQPGHVVQAFRPAVSGGPQGRRPGGPEGPHYSGNTSQADSLAGSEAMIPMRDGVRLYTQIYAPARAGEPLPIILLRTPYGTGQLNPARIATALSDLAADGYIFVMQDIRGRFKSEGSFVMLRQPRDRADAKAIDESTDTYDTIDWLLAHVPNHNGRIGIGGTSYGAWLAVMVNAKYFHDAIPTWNDFVNHPDYDAFWKRQAFAPWLTRVTVPTLNVAGWWDQEDFYGPLKIYELLERHDLEKQNFLVVGPWNHGGWSNGEGQTLGRIDFGSATASYYRHDVQARFFARYLKDKGSLPFDEALTFRTGANQWVRHEVWPPQRGVLDRRLYFQAGGKLSFDPPPAADPGFDAYVSDPANPVPYRPRPITVSREWPTWLVEDQRFVDHRPDVLAWATDPLGNDLIVTGKIVANLFASTSGTDSDWIVKLIDVLPESDPNADLRGFQLMIAGDVMRARYRSSLEKPEPTVPNAVVHYEIGFPGNDHVFRAGHRIMVQVQSTWFPVIDRNPQRFVPNIFLARASDFQPATQRIFRSGQNASYIAMPVAAR